MEEKKEKIVIMLKGEVVAELKQAEKLEGYLGKTDKP